MADVITTSPEAAYVTKPNILVPKVTKKAFVESKGEADVEAAMGQATAGVDSPVANVATNVPTLTTVQET